MSTRIQKSEILFQMSELKFRRLTQIIQMSELAQKWTKFLLYLKIAHSDVWIFRSDVWFLYLDYGPEGTSVHSLDMFEFIPGRVSGHFDFVCDLSVYSGSQISAFLFHELSIHSWWTKFIIDTRETQFTLLKCEFFVRSFLHEICHFKTILKRVSKLLVDINLLPNDFKFYFIIWS